MFKLWVRELLCWPLGSEAGSKISNLFSKLFELWIRTVMFELQVRDPMFEPWVREKHGRTLCSNSMFET